MLNSKMGIITVLILLVTTPGFSDDMPGWQPDNWWEYNAEVALDFNGNLPAEITLQIANNRQFLTGIETRTMTKGTGGNYSVYVLSYEALMYGTGKVHLQDPIPISVDVRLSDSLIIGEILVETSTLNLVSRSFTASADLQVDNGSEWSDVGDLIFDYTEEFDSPRDLIHFPLEVGNTWNDSYTVYWFGEFQIVLNMFGEQVDSQVFDQSGNRSWTGHAVASEDVNDIPAIRTEFTNGMTTETIWYGDATQWVSKLRLSGPGESGIFYVSSWASDLLDYGLTYATPLPTRTPEPPTPTPPEPSPTVPPPTPTGTPPTPTPTYTLPPWFPPTPTFTPQPPTATPLPPDDRLSIRIRTNAVEYSAGDGFILTTTITNPLTGIMVDEYILLELDGDFWFWPSWGRSVDSQFRIIAGNSQLPDEVILTFTWPEIAISLDEVIFWGILTEPQSYVILGDYGTCAFSFH